MSKHEDCHLVEECGNCSKSKEGELGFQVKLELEKTAHEETKVQLRMALEKALDPFTGLLHKLSFRKTASSSLELCKRDKSSAVMFFADLDEFKQVNDTYGHDIGDNVIKEVVAVLKTKLRKSDILGREGGDEFLAFLPETSLEQAMHVVEKIKEAFKLHAFDFGDKKLLVSVSIGVIEVSPEIDTIEKLIKAADKELYKAKRDRGK